MGKNKEKVAKRWDRRPWPENGDTDADMLFAAIGRSLTCWEQYETRLAMLFSMLVSPFNSFAARRGYAAIRTHDGREQMLIAASKAYFVANPNELLQAEFTNIIRDCHGFGAIRNDIAHGVVDIFKSKEDWLSNDAFDAGVFALYPSWASVTNRDIEGVPTYCMTSVELAYFCGEFSNIRTPVTVLCKVIGDDWNKRHASLYRPLSQES